ncbi:MAG: S9 family peptidase [Lentimicrobiaceae bacterium]|nr:S9 family peptidase [Lentimicrobiaceae bacterium]MBT5667979.1 S9 family peptidase [Lentimicrobiaceae bacterium]MBT6015666.1 S9 family peptidase [Lentimicrobiaceae bacterium]MBT6671944.1 S9 family peptidase [Lentimicrobiaceae bacterium]MBT6962624.1 S9 family peptidase [Lentimicrobiaceae bacterium]
MNKMNKFSLLVILLIFAVQLETNAQQDLQIIDKPNITMDGNLMTPEALWSFGRVSDPQVSPDGKTVIYGVSYYSIDQNKGNRDLYSIGLNAESSRRLTKTIKSEFNAIWRPDGKKIGFLTSESGSVQLWEMNPDGSGRERVSDIEGGITGFKYSPDQTMVLYTKEVELEDKFKNLYEGLPLASGRLMDDLMYRHWDHWVDTYSHVFYSDYEDGKLLNHKDIMEGEPWSAPLSPFGGVEQIEWSSDGKTIAYTCKKLVGKDATISTNSEIYFYDINNGITKNMTEGIMGFDVAPSFSPDGKWMAWESMERDGYESDQSRLYLLNLQSGEKIYATKDFDQNVRSLSWTENSESIYFTSDWHGAFQIYRYDLNNGKVKQITEGLHDFRSVSVAGDNLVATKQTMSKPTELYLVNPKDGYTQQMTFTNKDLLDQISMGETEERWIKTHDGEDMQVFVIYPPNFDKNKKYPTLLYCKGGPQGPLSQSFHYRWNYQIMAANGYIIVAPARRGVSGFGQAWQEQISGDYHGKSMQDYLTAIDELSKEPFIDEDRLGAVGASAGGYAVFYLAGNHDKRFKAFIAHDGIFNEEAQYLETEEMWFENWDKGGPFWEEDNEIAQEAYAHSPHKYVQNWDTPILVIHGELDYRVVVTQGMTAFNAAILRDVPAEYLYFPDENHWVLKPQNGILWQRTFFNWLDKWLK